MCCYWLVVKYTILNLRIQSRESHENMDEEMGIAKLGLELFDCSKEFTQYQ